MRESFIDDIIDIAVIWNEHMETLKLVCKRLNGSNVTLNLLKQQFGQAKLVLLCHVAVRREVAQNCSKSKYL